VVQRKAAMSKPAARQRRVRVVPVRLVPVRALAALL
jgi:hypothetical protein